MICPRAEADDGEFDVCLAGELGRLEVVKALAASFAGRHLCLPKVSYVRGRVLTVDGPPDLPIHADGQVVGCLPARFEILPRAVQVICPAAAGAGNQKRTGESAAAPVSSSVPE